MRKQIDHTRLTGMMKYDPITGLLTRLTTSRNGKFVAGSQVGWLNQSGYLETKIDGIHYKCHRLVWFYVTGEWPLHLIDHRNNDRSDNRWDNFRLADTQENAVNQSRRIDSPFYMKGVSFLKSEGRFRARISINKKSVFLGYFNNAQEAADAYDKAALEHFGEFALTNAMIQERMKDVPTEAQEDDPPQYKGHADLHGR